MSLSTGRARLMTALKDLRSRWDKVRGYWDDAVSDNFEKEFLSPLESKVRNGITAMESMRDLIEKAKRDCE